MSKFDFKKDFKALYKAPEKGFVFVEVPPMLYLMADGVGDPNIAPEFPAAVEALYGTAYTIKFSLKKAGVGPEYTVAPLSGLWWCAGIEGFDVENRDIWRWTMMIAQPPHVERAMVDEAVAALTAKGKKGPLDRIRFETFDEGLCVQTLHVGPYCEEGPKIEAMHRFVHEEGYSLRGRHHEVYLSDPRRTAPEKLKTILRHPVSK
ncbi:MAG: GyrI-like domain-containing protein [Syntrophobacteraceae bacterium]